MPLPFFCGRTEIPSSSCRIIAAAMRMTIEKPRRLADTSGA